ncbi:hypothetical protein Vretimale_5179 [Volvox reticuliferus]|nr:hypothetical protein Vretimale_5179 [Volvox reticuliferus]
MELVLPPPATAGSFGLRPQVLLFSATMPETVTAAAAQWLQRPEVVLVSSTSANAISRTVTQVVQVCAEHKKPEKLLKHLSRVRDSAPPGCRNPPRVLVFANRVKTVRYLTTTLSREGYKVAQLHGQRSQAERNQAVADFRSGKAQVLVATDVAARGLDIRSLPYVVNYDFPSRLETYVHRVGRTGRLAAYGHAYSFFSRNLAPLAPPLLELLRAHDQAVDPNLVALAAAWKVAEEKLGGKGVAAAQADDTGGDGEDDDEGDGRAAGASERLSLAEEVLIAAEDLMEGLGPRDARAIAALVKKKLVRKQQAESPGKDGDTSAADVAATSADAADNDSDDGVDVAAPVSRGKKPRRGELKELKGAAANAEGPPGGRGASAGSGGGGGRASDTYLVPISREQRKAMQQQQQREQQQPASTVVKRQAAFVPAKAFTGAMVGYAFKKGLMGLGYYVDPHQVAAAEGGSRLEAAAKVAATPPGKKPPGAAAVVAAVPAAVPAAVGNSKAGGKKTAAAAGMPTNKKKTVVAAAGWGLPTRNKPIIPVRHSDFLSDSDDDSGGGGGDSESELDSDLDAEEPPVAGLRGRRERGGNIAARKPMLGAGKEKRRNDRGEVVENGIEFGFGAEEEGDDDLGDMMGQRAIAKRRYKALPGRLRQKLKGQKKQG